MQLSAMRRRLGGEEDGRLPCGVKCANPPEAAPLLTQLHRDGEGGEVEEGEMLVCIFFRLAHLT